ncbi:MAG TPA: hypothetical protein PLC89_04060 [Haliscomenobacter sp.]|uniref:hypothetical protein n=1 Tax=Haliscomenobacter sp. TaxID=2717303 RepID=UPI001DB9865C|nr:hypothetical protein [Haliscomenobacter sp.]MBK9490108.1 hypothetical protein [Haliscomenobacter sp.]HOY16439.1 hypothetical protein [Haliscomenobacter sp.]HPH19697.1 hypothetical protein [Haliscomenobacter sp.]
MKKDILIPKVEDLAIAIVPGAEDDLWDVYLLNFKQDPLTCVLINSNGYGEIEGERVKTTTLRHFFEEVPGQSYTLIEPIQDKLFSLANEYWVSFVYDELMYDKKYVFVHGSISKDHFTTIPFLEKKGVMIR